MTALELMGIGTMVVLGTATAFLMVGLFLLYLAKDIVKRNMEEMNIIQSLNTEKLVKVENDIVAHVKKIDQYLAEKKSDIPFNSKGGGFH